MVTCSGSPHFRVIMLTCDKLLILYVCNGTQARKLQLMSQNNFIKYYLQQAVLTLKHKHQRVYSL